MRTDAARRVSLGGADERAFRGPPPLAFDTVDTPAPPKRDDPVHRELAALPRPRKHYHWYYSTREANADMHHAPQGVHDFLRAYYHHKSADWKANQPYPLKAWSADELAKLPTYYVMDLAQDDAGDGRGGDAVERTRSRPTRWLPDDELAVYSAEYQRTGFQGGLQWYRCGTSGAFTAELADLVGPDHRRALLLHLGQAGLGHLPATRRFRSDADDVPARACSACHLIDGAGHWVQQEQPDEVGRLLLQLLEMHRCIGAIRFPPSLEPIFQQEPFGKSRRCR